MAQLTAKQVAERLGISDARVRQLILEGKLPAQKFGNVLSIDEADLVKVTTYGKPGRPPKQASDKTTKTTRGRAPKQLVKDQGSATIRAANKGSKQVSKRATDH